MLQLPWLSSTASKTSASMLNSRQIGERNLRLLNTSRLARPWSREMATTVSSVIISTLSTSMIGINLGHSPRNCPSVTSTPVVSVIKDSIVGRSRSMPPIVWRPMTTRITIPIINNATNRHSQRLATCINFIGEGFINYTGIMSN